MSHGARFVDNQAGFGVGSGSEVQDIAVVGLADGMSNRGAGLGLIPTVIKRVAAGGGYMARRGARRFRRDAVVPVSRATRILGRRLGDEPDEAEQTKAYYLFHGVDNLDRGLGFIPKSKPPHGAVRTTRPP